MSDPKRLRLFLLCFVATVLSIGMLAARESGAADGLNVTAPEAGGVVLPEMDEFASTVLGDPWEMNEKSDLAFFRMDSQMVNSTFTNGIYSAQMTNGQGGERVTLLTAGAQNNAAMRIGKIGYNFPINANHYRYLTLRFYKSCTNCNSGLVQWYATDAYTNSVMGVSNSYDIPAAAGWHTVVVDLETLGIQQGGQDWSGTIRELLLHPFAGPGAANATFKLDWARLTAVNPNTARPFTITWTGGSGSVDLYASLANTTLDENDFRIASDVSGSTGSYTFQTGVLPAGAYYIGVDTGSGVSWSSGPLTINTLPQITITQPSMTSGEEYGQNVAGNAWDMNESSDLNDVLPLGWDTCVSNPTFSGGIHTAVLIGCATDVLYTDARFIIGHLNPPGHPDPLIDTDKYRYLSFRHFLHGEQNVQEGWVSRFGWWQEGADGSTNEATVMSRDIVLQEDWHTYKIDLWAADVVDEAHPVQRSWRDSAPNRLRLDPVELYLTHLPATVQTDWIRLTAMDAVAVGAPFPIGFDVSEDNVTLTFYYDTDTNAGNGHTLIDTSPAPAAASTFALSPEGALDHFIYLPIILDNPINCDAPGCYNWNTADVAPGIYYICINVADASNSVYRCSEAPVNVHH